MIAVGFGGTSDYAEAFQINGCERAQQNIEADEKSYIIQNNFNNRFMHSYEGTSPISKY